MSAHEFGIAIACLFVGFACGVFITGLLASSARADDCARCERGRR